GIASSPVADVAARGSMPTLPARTVSGDAALGADVSVSVADRGDIRLGAWGEMRTSSGPVLGGELIVAGLPPRPDVGHFVGTGSLALRVGGNEHVLTTALAFGYTGWWWSDTDPWISWARHVGGVRVVASMDRSLDDPRAWSATLGLGSIRSLRVATS